MAIETIIELNPWQTPNFATVKQKSGKREEGFKEAHGIPVSDLTNDALEGLAAKWLDDLYEKAGRRSPFSVTRAR